MLGLATGDISALWSDASDFELLSGEILGEMTLIGAWSDEFDQAAYELQVMADATNGELVLVAHSQAGWYATLLFMAHPELTEVVDRVVLVSPAAISGPGARVLPTDLANDVQRIEKRRNRVVTASEVSLWGVRIPVETSGGELRQ